MRILLTGGAGFIGSHIGDALIADGHAVLVFDNLSTGRKEWVPEGATFVHGDVRDAAAITRAVADFDPDVVCHQAAQTSVSVSTREPARDASVNIVGGLHLLEACRRHSVRRMVFASTGGAIYGEVGEGMAADESWAASPQSPYACSKLSFERYLQAYREEHGFASTTLRYSNVYGPRQDPHGEAGVVAIFTRRLLERERIRIYARQRAGDDGCVRDYVYVDDVVRANQAAIEGRFSAPTLNVGTGVGTSTRALAGQIEAVLRSEASIENTDRRPGDLQRSVLRPHRAFLELGACLPLSEGIRRTVDWFRVNG